MSIHLVQYLQHVRREFLRAIDGVEERDLERHIAGLNNVAWIVSHLSWQEQEYWLESRGEQIITPLDKYKYGAAPSSPNYKDAINTWEQVTSAANPWLEQLAPQDLVEHFDSREFFQIENVGSLMMRVIGHYYFHIGQISAIRRFLGYDVPTFVGSQDGAYFKLDN